MNEPCQPLTPPDCDLRDFAFMPLDVRRLFTSETWLLGNAEEKVAALALWCESWHQVPAASLPCNDKMLAHLSQAGARWPKVREHVLRSWKMCSDGRLYHPVVAEKALESWEKKKFQRKRSKAANDARWGKKEASFEFGDADGSPNERGIEGGEAPTTIEQFRPKGMLQAIPEGIPQAFQEAIHHPSLNDPKGQGQGEGEGKEERKKDPEPNGSARSDPIPPANGAHPDTGQESDEDRFWAMAGQCETKGITRSRMGRLMKLINAGELNYREAMNLITASLRAREPSTYFGKAVGDREKEAGLRQPKEPPKRGAAKVPPFVAELQAEGIEVVPDGAGRWKSEGKTYDDSGGLIGW